MDIWNNQRRLASIVNNMRARIMIGGQRGNNVHLRAESFTGVKTIAVYWMRERTSFRFEIEMEVSNGRSKLILVRKDLVTTLIAESGKETKILKLDKGFNRLRIVGEQAKLVVKMKLIKGVDTLD